MKSSYILKALALTLALTASSNAFAASAYELLSRDLAPSIKSLKGETRFYHYFWAAKKDITQTNLKTSEGRDSALAYRMKQVGGQFFTSNSTAYANAGNGLYLAIDPHASSPDAAKFYSPGGTFSQGFGDTMMEVTLTSGTQVINLENSNKIILQADTLEALQSEGINISTPPAGPNDHVETKEPTSLLEGGRFSRDTVRYMARPGAEAFRSLVNSIFNENQISLIQYSWQSSASYLCGGKAKSTALVWIGDYGVNRISSNVLIYWPNAHFSTLTAQEEEAYVRNKLMLDTFTQTRPLENAYKDAENIHYTAYRAFKAAKKIKDQAEMDKQKAIMDVQKPILDDALTQLKTIYSTSFADETVLNDVRAKTFECVKEIKLSTESNVIAVSSTLTNSVSSTLAK